MNDDEKEKLIHDYILSHVTYTDEGTYGNAYAALYYGKTSCAGYAMLTYKMLKAAGIDNIIVTNIDHAWNILKINDKWYHLDSTWDDGKKRNDGFYKYYNLTDTQILTTHSYTNTSGILCTSNYITDLTSLNNSNSGKYDEILTDIQKNTEYIPINIFKSNANLNLLYTDVVLKEGEQISLIGTEFPTGYYDDAYVWNTSDSDVAAVSNGVITAKKAGKSVISAVEGYGSGLNNGLFATIYVVPKQTVDGKIAQALSTSKITGFTDIDVVPQITIHSSGDVNTTTTATNCMAVLDGKVNMIGQPIDIKTTSSFDWADIGFKLSATQLSKVDINSLVIYWYDEENGTMVPQATKVDAATGTVYATVTHFSSYVLSTPVKNSIDMAIVIDSYYGSNATLATFKTNIINTVLELRKNSAVRITFVDNNATNPKRVQNKYFSKQENPTTITNNEVINNINTVFANIKEQNHSPLNQAETMKICTDALTLGRDTLRSKTAFPKFLDCTYKNYALPYTQWNGYFVDNNSIILDMKDSIGLIVGQTIGYYEDQPIAYNQSNVVPLAKFLLRGDSSLVTLSKTGKFSWTMKENILNNANDVIVLHKTLIMNTKHLNMEAQWGNQTLFSTYCPATTNAVKAYQRENGLTANGETDVNVWKKLGLPWDSLNQCPLRTSSKYISILNNKNFYLPNPTVKMVYPVAGRYNLSVGQKISVTATGTNVDHITLFISDGIGNTFTLIKSGTSLNYEYVTWRTGTYVTFIAARNCPGSFGGTLIASGIATFTVTAGDRDLDGILDDVDLLPDDPFKTPVILIHGRTDNTQGCFGAVNSIGEGDNKTENSWLSKNNKYYGSYDAQKITSLEKNKIDEYYLATVLADTNPGHNYKINKNLFAFNYGNIGIVEDNASLLDEYIFNLVTYVKNSGDITKLGSIFPTRSSVNDNKYMFDFIGHSMGGLVSRFYIENLKDSNDNSNSTHARKFISIDTPHWGSRYAYIAPWPCDGDLSPVSKLFGSTDKGFFYKRSDTLTREHGNTKYFAIAGVNTIFQLSKSKLMMDLPTNLSTFGQLQNVMDTWMDKNVLYNVNHMHDDIGQMGDDIVNFFSQIGWGFLGYIPDDSYKSKIPQKVEDMDGISVNIVSQFSTPFNSLHVDNQHFIEVINKVVEYLKK